jgi:acyl-coenzyme A thioesterase PaaI-like protein
MGETLDFVAIHIALGEAVFQGRPRQRHYNPLGTVHGGWFATLLDTAVGCAVHAGRQVATAEGRIVGPDGKLYAHATTTCLIFDQRVPG